MKSERRDDLETFIHAELRRLPEVKAPGGLHQRVLAAVAEQQADALRPWWRRAWWNWPVPARVSSLLMFLTLGAVVCALPWTVAGAVSEAGDRLASVWAVARHVAAIAAPSVASLGISVKAVSTNPWVLGGAGLVFLTYLFLVGVGTFYVRFAFLHATASVRHER